MSWKNITTIWPANLCWLVFNKIHSLLDKVVSQEKAKAIPWKRWAGKISIIDLRGERTGREDFSAGM
ncbi:hypothetical protein ACNKHN_18245 [Shigella flexneri]